MFENLIESKPQKKRSLTQTIVSLVVHAALIFAAVRVTAGAAETIREIVADTTMVFLKPPPPPPPPPPDQPPPDVIVSQNPPPKGFQTVVAPTDIPKDIPPVDLTEKPFDPRDFTGRGVEGGIAAGIVGGTGPVEITGEVFLEAQLDDPVRPISIPTPRYPPVLQSAGIAGRVELQYVVDTTGHAEPGSFKVLKTTHAAFVEPAKEAISKGVFKPARYRGQPVRQLVQQAIAFRVGQ
ncbi:MAG TPA: energy transducer TonB [Gemmatimonadales bacterium]|nr:energy transducer TonB [Gemmatimonadales bacterium]